MQVKFTFTLFFGCFAIYSLSVQAVCGPRIRKSWDRLTGQEKDVFKRAVQKSMDDGYYIKFVEMHTEMMSEMQAHRTCVFLFWHRRFITGFENMLRAYGGEFACITLPYWDWVTDSARYANKECKSMQDCSSILREIGGSAGPVKSVLINGVGVGGYSCVAASPMGHFCESSSVHGNQCAKCIPRGNWTKAAFPPSCNFASLYSQVFTGKTMAEVSNSIERGSHSKFSVVSQQFQILCSNVKAYLFIILDSIHNSLSGTMAYLSSPADIVFYAHHVSFSFHYSFDLNRLN